MTGVEFSRVKLSDDCIAREVGGETVLLDLRKGVYFGLNETGTRIWQLLAEGVSTTEIVDALEADHSVPREQLENDVRTFVADLLENNLAAPSRPSGDAT